MHLQFPHNSRILAVLEPGTDVFEQPEIDLVAFNLPSDQLHGVAAGEEVRKHGVLVDPGRHLINSSR